jgi:elongation factor Ts
MKITTEDIKKLREQTSAPVMECRTAIEEAEGDFDKAVKILAKKGIERAEKKADRVTKAGRIEVYSHMDGRIGVLVEVLSETDFVARNDEFKKLSHELALQIASMKPESVEDLLKQAWIRDPNKTISDIVKETIGKLGENIVVKRFSRFELGE